MNTVIDLDSVNAVLAACDPPRIVEWAWREYGDGLLMSSSFGAESAALIHIVTRVVPRIRVVMIDTGYLFAETHACMESLSARLDLNVSIYRSLRDPVEYLRQSGETDSTIRRDVESCCAANKNEPFDRAMRELKPAAWLRGIRRDQTTTRSDRAVVECSKRYDCIAISPLLAWSTPQLHQYMNANDLPYHPLYAKGYLSIGCNPLTCTRPVAPGEDARSGRWAGQDKTECGLHLDRRVIG